MKYIIDVPTSFVDITKGLHIPVDKLGNSRIDTGLKVTRYTEPDRKAIEDEVWKMARMIALEVYDCGLKPSELYECFGHSSVQYVMKTHSYQEAKAKFEAWKNQKDEIRVGDEVEAESGNKACVLYENPVGTQVFVFKADGTAAWWSKNGIHKTGRHFNEFEELLKKIGE